MTITTLYDLEDLVWYMADNEPKEDTIILIGTGTREEGTTINYGFAESIYKEEADVFATLEDLLDSFLPA